MRKDRTFLFLLTFSIRCLGNGQNVLKKEHFKIITVDGKPTYVVGTRKEDLDALLKVPDETKQRSIISPEVSVVIEAANICECMDILLWYFRSGILTTNQTDLDCTLYLNKKIFEKESIIGLSFKDWPVTIKKAVKFDYCSHFNKKYKDMGILVCGEIEGDLTICEGHLCPLVHYNSALDDGECSVSAHIFDYATPSTAERVELNGQQFIIKTII